MTHRKHPPTYTAGFRERGILLYNENRSNYPSNNAAYKAIALKLGFLPDSCAHGAGRQNVMSVCAVA